MLGGLALEELRDDDHVVKNRLGRDVLLFQERDNEVVQILSRDGLDRGFHGEVLEKALQNRPVLAHRVRFLQRFDLAQGSGHGV
jgi:hypothetical protein